MAERIGVVYAEITGDLTRLNRALAQSDEKLKRFSRFAKGEGELDLDTSDFDAAIKAGEAKLARLEKKRSRAVLDLDVRGVQAADLEIETLKAQLEALHDERVKVTVDVDRSVFDRLQQALVQGEIGGRGGPPRGLLAFIGGTGGSGKFISALGGHSLPVLTGAAIAAEGALGALAAASVALGAALAPLAGTLAALPGLLSGVGQLGGSLFATFSGIGDAVKAQSDVTTKSVVDGTAALERERAATEAVRGAKLSLAGAQRQATDAQTALTQARKDATRTLEDMKNRAKDAALAESGAALSLREAQSELRKVSSDPASSILDIERAQLGIKVARQAAKEARQEAQRARADSDKAQKGGVDKTPQVVSARKQLAEANRSVAESSRALATAQQQAAAGTDKLSSSQQKLNETMAKLSPAGRQFVRFIGSLRPAFRSIRNASQEAALPNFQAGIEGAMKNLPTFRQQLTNTSRVLGTAGKNFGKFVGGKGFGKDFQIIARANNNVMRNLGRALIPLTKAFNDIGVAAAPFTRWLGRAVLHLARLAAHSAKAGRESGGLARFLRRTRTVMEELSKITANLVGGLGGLFKAAFPQGRGFLELLTRITGKFDKWANSGKGQNSIKKFMEDQEGPLKAVGQALVAVIRLIKDLATAPGSGEGLKLFARATKLFADALDFLARIPGVGTVIANMTLLAVVAGRFGRLGPAILGLRELAAGLKGVAAADAASATGLRSFGLRVRGMLSSLARTRVGETIAGNIAAGLGVGAIKFRKAVDGFRGLMNRILRRGGIAAGTSAAEGAAAELGAAAAPTGALGKLKGRFGRLGTRLGGALAIGMAAGLALGLTALLPEVMNKLKEKLGLNDKGAGFWGDAADFFSPDKLLPDLGKREGWLSKLLGIDTAKDDTKDLKKELGNLPSAPAVPLLRKPGAGPAPRPRRDKPQRESAPTRTKTVEIQTPILSLSAKTVERSMNRIQTVLRRELGQARRLISRQVENWDDAFKDFRLLRGDDPLHLGSGIRKSAEDARKALRAIVSSLGNVLERLSSLARIEGREVGSQLAKGLGTSTAIRAAERLRAGVVSEFGKMKRQSSVEAQDMVSNLRATFSRLPEVVSRSTSEMLKIVLTAMRALGATGRGKIVAAVDRIEGKAKGGFVKKARGGYIPGSGLQDTVPLELPPGSVVENRHQIPVIDYALQMFDRLRYAVGGRVPVLAAPGERVRMPEEVPHVQRALALTASQGIQPFSSLEEVFGTITRPHYLAEGGQIPDATQRVVQRVVPAAIGPFSPVYQDVVQRRRDAGLGTKASDPSHREPASRALGGLSAARYAKGGKVRGIVPIPGQPGESIHSSIVKQVVSLMRRYKGRVTDGYAPSGHKAGGEHPKGLAVDVVPGPGGSWDRIDKLASWAEPSQGSPRAPFRWVGWLGDAGHGPPGSATAGRTPHLHLSWGGDGGSIEMTPRIKTKVKGPGGAAKELVGAAVKKVKGAANQKLRDAEGVLSASGAVGKGGPLGKPTQNMKLGRQLMRRVFKGDQWPALRTLWQGESGWKTTADNPSSSAYGIPQALPGSKMRSAGKDWETNPATQIKWGLKYIKDRYGTPSKALAAWRSRSPHWYAKGGFVGGLQRLASGGFVDTKPSGAKDPPGRKKSGIYERGSKFFAGLKKPHKKVKVGRIHAEYPRGLIDQFTQLWDVDLSETGPLIEDYTIAIDDASITDEVFIVDDPAKQGSQTVDWTAVRIRISELTGLRTKALDIESKIAVARDLALNIIERLKATIQVQVKRIGEIYKRLTANIAKLKELYARRIRQKKHLASERGKKGKNRDKSLINSIEDSVAHTEGLIRGLEGENLELGGLRSVLPKLPKFGEEFEAKDSKLGKIWQIGSDISTNLDPSGEGVAGSLFSIQGSTGRGGRLRDIGKDIGSYVRELADLAPGGKSVTLSAGSAGDVPSSAQDLNTFLGDLRQLFKERSNIKNLPTFHQGGPIPGPLNREVDVTALGGEIIVNPKTGDKLDLREFVKQLVVAMDGGKTVNIDARHSFANVPEDPHLYSASIKDHLEAAMS